jgi:peptide/nickel transport system substrate-binding protein
VAAAAAGVDFTTLDVDGVVATMQAVAGIYTDLSGEAIDFTTLIAEGTAIPEPPEAVEGEEAEEEPDLRPLIQIRLEDDVLAAEDPAAALTDYALEWLATAETAGLFEFAGYDFTTANKKVTYYYPAELFDITWHDGSPMTVGDFVMPMILPFATGKEGSPLYDPSAAQSLESSLGSFKGQKIISTDPLVIESYSDVWYEDAEYNAVAGRHAFWPYYGYGESAWSMIAVANLAEIDGELAYSADKADANEIEWMSWIGGPSLEILASKLDDAIASNYIPFEPTLGQFVTAEEAAAKYANLKGFYEQYGHFWSGTGPYILTDVRLVEKTATLTHNPNYIDLAGKWDQFAEPKVADIAVDGAGRVTIGEEATFDVFVTFAGEAYPSEEIVEVKYLLFNSASEIVSIGAAELVAEGQYLVTLPADVTGALETGANKLEVVAVAIPVSIPAIGAFEFVTE